jgi:hypothetical protein
MTIIYCLKFEIFQPAGPGSRIYFPQEVCDPVNPPGTACGEEKLLSGPQRKQACLRASYSVTAVIVAFFAFVAKHRVNMSLYGYFYANSWLNL